MGTRRMRREATRAAPPLANRRGPPTGGLRNRPAQFLVGGQVGSGVEWGKAAHTADQFFLPAQCTYVFTRISTPRGLWATTGLDLTTPSLKAQFCLLQLPTSAHGHLRSKRGWQKPSSENAQHQRGGSNLHMTKSFVSILLKVLSTGILILP